MALDRAIVLLQMGGPATLADLPGFYARLFADQDLIQLPSFVAPFRPWLARALAMGRARAMRDRYAQIGGGSPLLGHTLGLAAELEGLLAQSGEPALVRVAMRYAEPFAAAVVAELQNKGVTDVVLVPLYPHWSRSTAGSSVSDFLRAARAAGFRGRLRYVPGWGDDPGYGDLLVGYIQRAREQLRTAWDGPAHVLFSAHGLPVRYVQQGDPYPAQVERTARAVGERLTDCQGWSLSYQSRMGPVAWLRPSTDETLRGLAAGGVQALVAVPLGFVSDHIETLYDLDILYRQEAQELGIRHYERVPSFNADPAFAAVLARLVHGGQMEAVSV